MGRNGKQAPVFPEMVKFVNDNVGKVVSSKEILKEELVAAYATHAQLFSGRKTNYSDTQARNQVIRAAFLKAISRI